jgi:hypothetical protein
VELSIGECAGRLRSGTGAVVRFKDNRWLISSGEEMPIETILDNIELSPAKPLNSRLRKIVGEHHIPPFSPKKLLRNLLPELSWVKDALLIFVNISAERGDGGGHSLLLVVRQDVFRVALGAVRRGPEMRGQKNILSSERGAKMPQRGRQRLEIGAWIRGVKRVIAPVGGGG